MMGSTVSRRRLAGLAALVLAPSIAPSVARARNVEQSSATTTDALRYMDSSRRLTVQAMINGQGPFSFLVDTGASGSAISRELAEQLALPLQGTVQLHGLAGSQTVNTVWVNSLQVGRRMRGGMTLSVIERDHLGAAGLLGLEWLGNNSLMLDYESRRMHVGAALPLPDSQTIVVKARTKSGGLTLIDAVMPGARLQAFLDSGSTTTVGNLALLEVARRNRAIVGEVVEVGLSSVTGQVLKGRLAVLSRLGLGNITLRNVPLVVGQVHTFDYWGMNDKPAILIGSDILQQFETVALDFKRGEVRFRVSDRG
jgi:predicted aspartyl protease